MEMREGSKQTEIGKIPDDWEVIELKNVVLDMLQGVNTAIDKPEYVESGIPMLKANNIIDQEVSFDEADHISAKTYASYSNRFKLKNNDFLFSNIGARLGTGSLLKVDIDCSFAWNVMRIVPDPNKIIPQYLSSIINSPKISQSIRNNQAGSGMGFVPKGVMEKVRFPIPPTLAEQEAIATALRDTDALIESLELLIAKKRHIKQGAMQKLLRPKKGWVEKRLDAIADIRSGGTPSTSRPEFWDGDIPWCTPTDITALQGYKYITFTGRTITPQGLKTCSAEMIPANSIVMTSRATIGECAINKVPLSTNQGFKNFVLFKGIDIDFLYYLLRMQKQRFISLCGGSTFLEIGKSLLAEFIVILPKEENEQKQIAIILSDMDTELAALETKLAKARQLKLGMMHELLTGKIRLV